MSYFVNCTICGYVHLSSESSCPVESMDEPPVSSVFRVLWQKHRNHAMTQAVESVAFRETSASEQLRDLLDQFIDYRTTRSLGTTEMRAELARQMIGVVGKALAPPNQVSGRVRLSEEDMNPLMKGERESTVTFGPITSAEQVAVAKQYGLCLDDAQKLLRDFAKGRGLL